MSRLCSVVVVVGALGVWVAGCGTETTDGAIAPLESLVCGTDGETYSVEDADTGGHMVAYRGRCDEPMPCGAPEDCFVGDDCVDASGAPWCVPGPTRCDCAGVFEPVCGGDGRNYINVCEAACADVGVQHGGYCEEPPPGGGCVRAGCSSHLCVDEGMDIASTCEWRPVYECYQRATCERQENDQCGFTPTYELVECLERHGEGGCICTDIYLPVCGVDGRTYGNGCEAECKRVEILYEGECNGDCPVETHIRNLDGECVPKCYGPEQCEDGQTCNSGDVCRQDPACPACDVCVGWCVDEGRECRPTGCNGEICASRDIASPCVALPEFACYADYGVCELQPRGECGWSPTPKLEECLARFD